MRKSVFNPLGRTGDIHPTGQAHCLFGVDKDGGPVGRDRFRHIGRECNTVRFLGCPQSHTQNSRRKPAQSKLRFDRFFIAPHELQSHRAADRDELRELDLQPCNPACYRTQLDKPVKRPENGMYPVHNR